MRFARVCLLPSALLFLSSVNLNAGEKAQDEVQIEKLKAGSDDERSVAATELGHLDSLSAVPALIEALRDRNDRVKIRAHTALNAITGLNLGYKNYEEWKSAWILRREEIRRYRQIRKTLRKLPVERPIEAKTLVASEVPGNRVEENTSEAGMLSAVNNIQAHSDDNQDSSKHSKSIEKKEGSRPVRPGLESPNDKEARTVESFRFIGAATTLREVTARLGAPDQDRGSGLFVYVYRLADGSEVLIGSADGAQVLYVRHGRAVLFERR